MPLKREKQFLRYQSGNQKPLSKEGQAIQWQKEKQNKKTNNDP